MNLFIFYEKKPPLILLTLILLCFSNCARQETGAPSDLQIWFDHPAQYWEEALPVGNGSLGAMGRSCNLSRGLKIEIRLKK